VIGERTPGATLTLVIHRMNGERIEVPVTCRLDTAEEVDLRSGRRAAALRAGFPRGEQGGVR
jgi:aconitase A